jgi:hypothetical protein
MLYMFGMFFYVCVCKYIARISSREPWAPRVLRLMLTTCGMKHSCVHVCMHIYIIEYLRTPSLISTHIFY